MKLFMGDLIDPTAERRRATMDLPGFSKKQIEYECLLFSYKVYHGRKPLYQIICMILRSYIARSPKVNPFYRKVINHKYLRRLKNKVATFNK